MAFDPARVKSLFLEASDLPSPEERAAYLDRECGGEPDLRARVEALLAVEERAGPVPEPEVTGVFQSAPAEALEATQRIALETLSGSRVSDPQTGLATVGATGVGGEPGTLAEVPSVARVGGFVPGQVIGGRYTLLEVLGEGGMGTVYRAEQSQPVKRQVALKLIKIGMDSRTVLARFDAERQALAMMDHPNIARVFDGGATDADQPFFVMEFVHGVPITDYCDQHRLSVDARLELFVAVCQAVQHAAPEGDHSPRPQALECDGHRGRRPPDSQGHRLRRGQGDRVQSDRPEPGRHRRDRRHADVHVARAGRPVDSGHRYPHRRLRPRRDPLRAAGRLAAAGRDPVQARGPPGNAPDGPGGRPVQAEHEGEHGRRLAQHRGQSRDRSRSPQAGAPGGPRLDRDEGAGEGPHPTLRDSQRFRGRHPASPGVGARDCGAAEPVVSTAEVRAEAPRRGDRGKPGNGDAIGRAGRRGGGPDGGQRPAG